MSVASSWCIVEECPIDPEPAAKRDLWSREVDVGAWLSRHRVGCWLAFGVACRVAQYWAGRPFWLDEMSLARNVTELGPAEFFGPLRNSQLATPGFLVLQWLAVRAFGATYSYSFRLVPLLSGVAALFLMARVAGRALRPGAAWIAVALFAVSEDLIYFSSEAKQYSTDVALSLAGFWMALRLAWGRLGPTGAVLLAGFGVGSVWFSHPSVFILASVGLVGIGRAFAAKDWRSVVAWAAIGTAWLTSFALVHRVAMDQLDHRGDMWAFWQFGFPPIPPRSAWDATWFPRRFALLFVNPLNFDQPIGPALSLIPALTMFLVGCRQIARLDRWRLALLLIPLALVFAASAARLYPFHGRLALFLTPILLLGVAAGLDACRDRKILFGVLLAVVLGLPTLPALYGLIEPRQRHFGNPYGDNRPRAIDPYKFPF